VSEQMAPSLLSCKAMKKQISSLRNVYSRAVHCLIAMSFAVTVAVAQKTETPALAPPPVTTPAEKAAVEGFENQVKEYVKLRNKIRENAPKLSKDSTPEQIHAYRTNLEESLRAARKGARRGEIFMPEIADFIRRTLKNEFKGRDRKEIREIAFETEVQGVVLRVNYPYAQSAELSEMPATLLAKLPQLPKEVRYRFVGRNLILVDRESNVIIDFMPDALP
jgi:hypothetical protein